MGKIVMLALLSTTASTTSWTDLMLDATLRVDAGVQPWSALALQGTEVLTEEDTHETEFERLWFWNSSVGRTYKLMQEAYPIDDLPIAAAELASLLTRVIAPETWNERGGLANLRYLPSKNALLVNQTSDAHERIALFFDVLRELVDAQALPPWQPASPQDWNVATDPPPDLPSEIAGSRASDGVESPRRSVTGRATATRVYELANGSPPSILPLPPQLNEHDDAAFRKMLTATLSVHVSRHYRMWAGAKQPSDERSFANPCGDLWCDVLQPGRHRFDCGLRLPPEPTFQQRSYDVADISVAPEALVAWIKLAIGPDSWQLLGQGTIAYSALSRTLIICQSEANHEELEELLRHLRPASMPELPEPPGVDHDPAPRLRQINGEIAAGEL